MEEAAKGRQQSSPMLVTGSHTHEASDVVSTSTSTSGQQRLASSRSETQQPNSRAKSPSADREERKMSKSASHAAACFFAELLGTFFLVLVGDGCVASFVVSKRPVDPLTACLGFGVGSMIAGFTAMKISGAHINPAASLAQALDGKLRWSLVPVYMLAQYLGAFLAALVLFLNYGEAIGQLDGGSRSAFGAPNSTGQIFATYPAGWTSVWGCLLDQIVGTAVLMFALTALGDRANLNLEPRHQPLVTALVVGFVCVAFLPNCGAILNPARDLGPRLLTTLVGYPLVWAPLGGLYWLTAALLGPHIGAILGLFAYKFLIGQALRERADEAAAEQQLRAGHQAQEYGLAETGRLSSAKQAGAR